jgi:phytoene synthase
MDREVVWTEGDLELYCERVAGSAAVLLAQMLRLSDPRCQTKLATLSRAAQRTNILRDIDEDLAQGRVYVARTTIERFGSLAPGSRAALLRDQIARADALYDDGLQAIPFLAREHRRCVALSAALYREILRQIERDGFGRRAGRAVVPAWRRRWLIARYRCAVA